MKVVVVDGQGGGVGKAIVDQLKTVGGIELYAVGTNAVATMAMSKAGASYCATGENAIMVNCSDADVIVGAIGIVMANSMLGEISPEVAKAVASAKARKFLIPMSKCHTKVLGTGEYILADCLTELVSEIKKLS